MQNDSSSRMTQRTPRPSVWLADVHTRKHTHAHTCEGGGRGKTDHPLAMWRRVILSSQRKRPVKRSLLLCPTDACSRGGIIVDLHPADKPILARAQSAPAQI